VKKYLRIALRRMKRWLAEAEEQPLPKYVPFDNTHVWINSAFQRFVVDPACARRKQYLWGVLQGVALGKVLGLPRVSVIEFGVAGGAGLRALEHIAERVEEVTEVGVDVYGFDTGSGLPKPVDYRDAPNRWVGEGQFAMNRELLQQRLRTASLKLGLVDITVPEFLRAEPAPVAFVSVDLDYYSSTRSALRLFDAGHDRLLPRVVCFFDDIVGGTHSDFTGERLAISEFNASHEMRKLSPIYGLKYFLPYEVMHDWWPELFYFAHLFDHPRYNERDQIHKPMSMDIEGKEH